MLERFRLYRLWPEVEVHDDEDMLWTASNLPFAAFNTVHRANLHPAAADAAISRVVERCTALHVPCLWWVGPLSRPSDLGARLLAHGFQSGGEQPGMAANLDRLPSPAGPQGLVVERVTDVLGLQHWWRIACDINHRPRELVGPAARGYATMSLAPNGAVRCYLGLWHGKPVATACLVLGAGVAGHYGVGTLAKARRMGIATCLTLATLADAVTAGFRFGVLRASSEGQALYSRLGFKEYCRVATYLWPGPGDVRPHLGQG